MGHSRRWYGSQAAGGTDASIQSPPLPLIPFSLQDKGMGREETHGSPESMETVYCLGQLHHVVLRHSDTNNPR